MATDVAQYHGEESRELMKHVFQSLGGKTRKYLPKYTIILFFTQS